MRAVKFFLLKMIFFSVALQAVTVKGQEFGFEGRRNKQTIGFNLVHNLIIIPLYLNKKGPFNFILDTGISPMIITDTAMITTLGLKNLRPIKIVGMGKGLEITALLAHDLSVKIGKASIDSMPTAVLKDDILGLSDYVGTKIHGLIGYYFFKSFLVEIKYANKRLTFSLPNATKKIRGEKIPLQFINNKPYVNIAITTAELGNITAKMVVDNGASHAVSLETLYDQPFPVPASSVKANLGVGLSGAISGSIGRIPQLQIGSYVFKNVISSYPLYDDAAAKTLLLNRNGNLGADILARFNVTFDYTQEAMYLKRNVNYNRPFEHDMSGMEVYLENGASRRYFISRIEPESPADLAGMQPDDEILSINLNPVGNLSLNDITRLLKNGNNRILFLSLNRKGSVIIKMIKLKKRI